MQRRDFLKAATVSGMVYLGSHTLPNLHASETEVAANPRARSAVMRVAERQP